MRDVNRLHRLIRRVLPAWPVPERKKVRKADVEDKKLRRVEIEDKGR